MKLRLAPLIAAIALAGCGQTSTTTSTRTVPPLPANAGTGCVVPLGKGTVGACAPRTAASQPFSAALAPGAKLVADFSNNDPLPCGAWRSLTVAGVYLKLSESDSFIDGTAAAQVDCGRRQRPDIYLGGYAFEHVCQGSPVAQADLLVRRAIALGLYGANTMPAEGDAEYGTCSTQAQAQAWQQGFVDRVRARLRRVGIYTGGWYWNPTFPCGFFPGDAAWISGYVSYLSSVPRLCGHSQIDLWQRSDNGFNGFNRADLSIWTGSPASFEAFVNASKPGPSPHQLSGWRAARDASLRAYKGRRCIMPIYGPAACATFAARVVHFQRQLGGQRIHCFGRGAQISAALCQITRPEVSIWSRARNATTRALGRNHCGIVDRRHLCASLVQRRSYFQRQITSNLY